MTFIDLCLEGKTPSIDDYIDLWHEGDSELSLAEYLGFRDNEYELWVSKPASLREILERRQCK